MTQHICLSAICFICQSYFLLLPHVNIFFLSFLSLKFHWLAIVLFFLNSTHTPIPVSSDLPSVAGSPSSLPSPSFSSHMLSLPVSPSFHSCPHILGSPVLRSRISLWNLVHLFPSLPEKQRRRHGGKTQRKYRKTHRGDLRESEKSRIKRERGRYCEEDEDAEHQAACCLMQLQWGNVAACTEHFSLHSLADWCEVWCSVLLYLSLHSNVSIPSSLPLKEDVCHHFMLADTLTFGLSTGQRIWIHFLVTDRGDQCGAQVRSSPSTERCQTTHNSEHSSFDHLKMNRGADKPGSPHYYDIQGRNKDPSDSLTWGFDSSSLWWDVRTQTRLCTQTWSDHQPFTYIMGTMQDRNEGRRQGKERKTASFGLNKEGTERILQDVADQIIPHQQSQLERRVWQMREK